MNYIANETNESVITGFYFDENSKFMGYIYSDQVNNDTNNKVLADKELVSFIINHSKYYDLKYTGKYNTSLTINDKALFIELPPERVRDEKGQEILDLKIAMAEMSEEKDDEILKLKLALVELVEGGEI